MIVANWKMNKTIADAVLDFEMIKNGLENIDDIKAVICPSYVWLAPLAEIAKTHSVRQLALGAQNVSNEEKGAFTGEVSAQMLKNLVEYCIVGHSEQVAHFGESPEQTRAKVNLLLKNQITPIACVGENVKSDNSIFEVINIAKQILKDLAAPQRRAVILCYEPVWAISSNPNAQPATGGYAGKVARALSKEFPATKILYGGSVDSKNIREFTVQDSIGGALVGSASLDPKEFLEILRNA
ncbi:MAG: triosephosphate isomerase (TIM) [Candidatus Berkelbacteria bacterium Licking1014_7]|uniref:Triosephosphate isomerase n=1 Tax=Candidatus Berkelbacteria bacterium Licking1014_7 TaxID=2017147 RepID=A0A554LJQ9_9BACT|nr:MAG: triosephosphate isomerase (TIM) [Candidatus Berkelbacteria bacterium Licking1014_7]